MTKNSTTSNNNSPKRFRIVETLSTGKGKEAVKTPKSTALTCVTGHALFLHPKVSKNIQ